MYHSSRCLRSAIYSTIYSRTRSAPSVILCYLSLSHVSNLLITGKVYEGDVCGIYVSFSTLKLPSRSNQLSIPAANAHFLITVKFLPKPGVTKKKGQNAEVLKLKQRLLEKARFTQRGISTSAEQRQDIDALITALEPCESTNILISVVQGGARGCYSQSSAVGPGRFPVLYLDLNILKEKNA